MDHVLKIPIPDEDGNGWLLGVDTEGRPGLIASALPPAPLYLLDYFTKTKGWQVTVATLAGQKYLVQDEVAAAANYANRVVLYDVDGGAYFLGVLDDGRFVTNFQPTLLLVGALYPGNGAYPTPRQPGGIGSPVTFPTQQPEEMTGKWVESCGPHSFNHYDVKQACVEGVLSALVCCPVCGFISMIITPASELHSEINMARFQ